MTSVYDAGGRVMRQIEAPGMSTAVTTSVPDHVYVTRHFYSWSSNIAQVQTWGPRDNDPTSTSYGAYDLAHVTALGWVTDTGRFDASGTRDDFVQHGYDRLGRETTTRRFLDPVGLTGAIDLTSVFDTAGRALTTTERASSPVTNTYDDWGEVLESSWLDPTSNLRRIQRFAYDGLGRRTSSVLVDRDDASGTESIESTEHYFFDAHSPSGSQPGGTFLGRLSYVEAGGVGDTYFGYDSFGRTTSQVHAFTGAPTVSETYSYAPGGAVTQLTLSTPAGTDRIGYTLDSAARTRMVTDLVANRALYNASSVDDKGRPHKVVLGNGVVETDQYATGGREELVEQDLTTLSGTRQHVLDARDADGRLVDEVWSGSSVPTVHTLDKYDALGRLTMSSQSDQIETFGYDPLGNQTFVHNASVTGQSFEYSYDTTTSPDRLCWVTATGGGTATTGSSPRCGTSFDGAGNVVSDGWNTKRGYTRTFTYDAASRVTSAQTGTWRASFFYGPGGALARTDVRNGFVLDHQTWTLGDLIEQRTRSDGHVEIDRRIPGPEGLIATFRTDTTAGTRETMYVHGDGRGNRFFTNSIGKIAQDVRYRAYGAVMSDSGTPSLMTYSDDLWNGGDDLRNLGVDLLGARLYDPQQGRFLQRDPLAFGATSTTGNPYAFAFGDPVNLADPSGMSPCPPESNACSALEASLGFGVVAGFLETADFLLHHHWGHSIPAVGQGQAVPDIGPSNLLFSPSGAAGVFDFVGNAAGGALKRAWDCRGMDPSGCLDDATKEASGIWENGSRGQWKALSDPLGTLSTIGHGDVFNGTGRVVAANAGVAVDVADVPADTTVETPPADPPPDAPPPDESSPPPEIPPGDAESGATSGGPVPPRTFTSGDPLVADLANTIEARYPGHVVGVNVPMLNAAGELVTDADILLRNAVIQVKSGNGKGLTSQLTRTQSVTDLVTIGFGPALRGTLLRGISRAGLLATTDVQLLLDLVAP